MGVVCRARLCVGCVAQQQFHVLTSVSCRHCLVNAMCRTWHCLVVRIICIAIEVMHISRSLRTLTETKDLRKFFLSPLWNMHWNWLTFGCGYLLWVTFLIYNTLPCSFVVWFFLVFLSSPRYYVFVSCTHSCHFFSSSEPLRLTSNPLLLYAEWN